MQRESNLICKMSVSVGIILNNKSEFLICRHHRQRLIVDIAGNIRLCHLYDNLVSLLGRNAGNARYVQMPRRIMFVIIMIKGLHAERSECSIIATDDLSASFEHVRIALKLLQANCGCDIGHIALIPCADNIVFPCAELCLSEGILRLTVQTEQLQTVIKIIIGYTYGKVAEQKPVTAGDLHAQGAMAALLKDALKPNLVQTLEGTPAIVHGGPFANIAHGCNSVTATKMCLKLADYTITEAGFGADLGAEKFLDIKCRMAGLKPNAVVVVATVRALKYNGGVPKAELNGENLEALEKGMPNLLKHVSNITNVYKLPCVVAINAFPTDTEAELKLVEEKCKELGVNVVLSEVWAKGGEGGVALAEEVVRLCEQPNDFTYAYDLEGSIEEKLNAIVQKIYGGSRVVLTANAQKQAKQLEALGFGNCPICMAKTQYSLTDDQTKLGAPTGFEVTVRNLKISAGAGFIVALTGDIMTMPGLPKVPAAERIDVDATGKITGLF